MSYAPLASFAGLSLGDYGLWKWSLAGNHQILAVVFGLTLPPLALAFAWMLVIASIRLFGALTRRPPRAAPPRRAAPDRPLVVRVGRRVAGLRRQSGLRPRVLGLRPRVTRVVPRPVVKPRVRAQTHRARVPAKGAGASRSPEHPPGKLAA